MNSADHDIRTILTEDRRHRRRTELLVGKIATVITLLVIAGIALWAPAHIWWYQRAADRDTLTGHKDRALFDESMVFLYEHPHIATEGFLLTLGAKAGYLHDCATNGPKVDALLAYRDVPQTLRYGLSIAQAQCAATDGNTLLAINAYQNAVDSSLLQRDARRVAMQYLFFATSEAKAGHPTTVRALIARADGTDPAMHDLLVRLNRWPGIHTFTPLRPYLHRAMVLATFPSSAHPNALIAIPPRTFNRLSVGQTVEDARIVTIGAEGVTLSDGARLPLAQPKATLPEDAARP